MKDLGDIVRISQNGATNPPSAFTNQWQRKLNGSYTFSDISGETGSEYTIQEADKNAKIRLEQKFTSTGTSAYSNELQVADFADLCADPTEYPHIEPSSNVPSGSKLKLWLVLKFGNNPEFPESGRLTSWYGTRRDNNATELILESEPTFLELDLTNQLAALYSKIWVVQKQQGYPGTCDPDEWSSNNVTIAQPTGTSFGNITVSGGGTAGVNAEVGFNAWYDGDVVDWEATVTDPDGGNIQFQRRSGNIFAFGIKWASPGTKNPKVTFVSRDAVTLDSPKVGTGTATIQAGVYIGNISIVPTQAEVTLGEQIQIDAYNDGNVSADDVQYDWVDDSSNGITLVGSFGPIAWYRFDQVGDNKPVRVVAYNNSAWDTPQDGVGYVNVVSGGTPTLGAVTMAGLNEVEVHETHQYEVEWTGTAQASDLSIQWAAGGGAAPSPGNVYNPMVTFNIIGKAFLMAQVSCSGCDDGSAQMPQKEITVKPASNALLQPGDPHGGGYVAGIIDGDGSYDGTYNDGMNDRGTQYYIIVAPKTGGESTKKWKTEYSSDGTGQDVRNRVFGRGATESLADNKHELFNWVVNSSSGPRKTNLGGYDDWYVPAHYELEIIYRNLKPGTSMIPTSGAACCGAMGKNPYSDPISDGYTSTHPKQTTIDMFKTGGAQAFSAISDYKSASQNGSSGDAANQYLGRSFDRGDDRNTTKMSATSRARVIRRVAVS